MQALELGAHVVAELGVEVGERLVEKQDARPLDERAAERDALLLAAARRAGLRFSTWRDAQQLGDLVDAPVDLGAKRRFASRSG